MVKKRFNENFISKNQQIRDFLFRPLIKFLNKLGLNANLLSNLKLIVFLPFIYFSFVDLRLAYLFILFSILIDIFDGPLARFQKKFSDKGKFLDIFGDFTIYLMVILILIFLNIFNDYILIYHLFIFPLIALLSTIRRQEFAKTDWIIKPAPELGHFNGLVYLCLGLFVYFNINYFNTILLLLNTFYTLLAIYYFIYIQSRWYKK